MALPLDFGPQKCLWVLKGTSCKTSGHVRTQMRFRYPRLRYPRLCAAHYAFWMALWFSEPTQLLLCFVPTNSDNENNSDYWSNLPCDLAWLWLGFNKWTRKDLERLTCNYLLMISRLQLFPTLYREQLKLNPWYMQSTSRPAVRGPIEISHFTMISIPKVSSLR